jgi:hypothetical protein
MPSGRNLSDRMKRYYADNPRICRDWSFLDPLIKQYPLHKKTVYNRAVAVDMKEAEYVSAVGLIKIKTKPKIKYKYSF